MKLLLTLLICTLVSVGYAYGQKAVQKSETTEAKVIRTIDGDTIEVELNGKSEKVRLIGVDAPELKDESARFRCFAYGALAFTDDHLTDLTVKLEADPTQDDRDKYGRLLRYVYYNNGNFNLFLIKQGFAYEYTYDKPYKYQKEFKEAQKYAEDSKWGLWDPKECK